MKIGIRREDKNIWERRVPIIPEHVKELAKRHGIEFFVQPSPIRIFKEEEYQSAGAHISEDIFNCKVVFAVKEIPEGLFRRGGVYVFFSHTIKGQQHNMPTLKRLLDLKCTLIDYEKITDEKGRRLVFFGRHAGLAGMIDTLWALGGRLDSEGIKNPFNKIKQAKEYHDLKEAKEAISKVGEEMKSDGLDKSIVPFVIGFAGYGHVAKGAWEIINCLPVEEITPEDIIPPPPPLKKGGKGGFGVVYKVIFKEEHMVEPVSKEDRFELQDYFSHPEKYRGCFEKYLPHLSVLVNCIYWDKRYPRLVTKDYLKKSWKKSLRVIGDISCDVEGSIEATVKCTDSGNPVFIYDIEKDEAVDWTPDFSRERSSPAKAGHPKANGPVILAVDNLPCEVPRESSADFSRALEDFIPSVAKADFNAAFEELALPPEIKRAVIAHKGELAPDYRYLEQYLK